MATKKKMLEAAAGTAAAGGASLDITDVFSTYLYTGNGSSQTITNGIDLDGDGGLVWVKSRGVTRNHVLVDTERGVRRDLQSNTTTAEGSVSGDNINAFYSDGFLAGPSGTVNSTSEDYASWTFRKAPKFFDVVTWTGNSSSSRAISHALDSVPGVIIIKQTNSGAENWIVFHRSITNASNGRNLFLNETTSSDDAGGKFDRSNLPTSQTFTIGGDNSVNAGGSTYVAYLFAHNNSDGEFGPDSDQDIIKCGSYTGVYAGAEVNLGWQPQWILFKSASSAGNWYIFDAMRGIVTGGLSGDGDAALLPNTSGAENVNTFGIDLTATGFIAYGNNIASSGNIIYMAIRRGQLAPPTAGTEVFGLNAYTGNTTSGRIIDVGFPVDLGIIKNRTPGGDTDNLSDRLRGPNKFLTATASNAENTSTNNVIGMDNMEGFEVGSDTQVNYTGSGYGPYIMWGWKRAPSYFDAVCYSGNSTAGRTVSHNLGVAPEMMWIKPRDLAYQWSVYHKDVSSSSPYYELKLNSNDALADSNNTNAPFAGVPTATTIPLPSGTASASNRSGYNYIAYLFASLAGVSKVGSYTGNQTNEHQINCGFATGARFVLAKKTSGSGDWYVFDSARGITTNYDPWLGLNSTDEEVSSDNIIRPFSSGFALGSGGQLNESGATYIFYAIA